MEKMQILQKIYKYGKVVGWGPIFLENVTTDFLGTFGSRLSQIWVILIKEPKMENCARFPSSMIYHRGWVWVTIRGVMDQKKFVPKMS